MQVLTKNLIEGRRLGPKSPTCMFFNANLFLNVILKFKTFAGEFIVHRYYIMEHNKAQKT